MAKLKIQGKEIEVNFTMNEADRIAAECIAFNKKLDEFTATEQFTNDNFKEYANKRFKLYADFLYNTIGADNIGVIVEGSDGLTLKEIDRLAADVCDALTAIIPKEDNQPKFSFK